MMMMMIKTKMVMRTLRMTLMTLRMVLMTTTMTSMMSSSSKHDAMKRPLHSQPIAFPTNHALTTLLKRHRRNSLRFLEFLLTSHFFSPLRSSAKTALLLNETSASA